VHTLSSIPTVLNDVGVERLPNGTVKLTWTLPPEIRDSDLLTIDINLGEGWVPITAIHLQFLHFEPREEYTAQLRFRHVEWTGYQSVAIPRAPDSTTSPAETALIYSVIIGGVAVGCAILVLIILALKYIQSSRRNIDKGED
jgi:hypothetical protein